MTFPNPLGYGHFLRLFQAKHCDARTRIAHERINFYVYHEINISSDHKLAKVKDQIEPNVNEISFY